MAPKNIIVKDRIMNDEIDLSMSDLTDIPVKDILQIKKAVSLDVSNNNITLLPKNFTILTHLTKLDLSRNNIKELPENFGDLVKLKHLDLYQNQLHYLPLGFSKLKALKWLDLKNNPLIPTIAEVAGTCLDMKECQMCAKNIVSFYTHLQERVDIEHQIYEKQCKKLSTAAQKSKKEKHVMKCQDRLPNSAGKHISGQVDVATAATVTSNVSSPTTSQVEKSTKTSKPPCSSGRWSCFGLFIFILALFYLLVCLEFKHTQILVSQIGRLFSVVTEKLPVAYKPYWQEFGHTIQFLHQKSKCVITSVAGHISDSELMHNLYDKVAVIIEDIVIRIRGMLRTPGS